MNLGRMIADLEIKTGGFKKAHTALQGLQERVGTFSEKTQKLSKNLLIASERMMRLGFYTSMYLTLPILGAGAATLIFQKRFGATMNRIHNLLGVSKEKIDEWRISIMNMGPKTGKGPFAFARALEMVLKEGVKVKNAFDLVKEAAKAASIIGIRHMSQLAQVMANVSAAMGVSTERAAGFVTQLIATEMQKTGIWRLGAMFGEMSGNARALGVSLKDLGAIFATITDEGRLNWRVVSDLDKVWSDLLVTAEEGEPKLNAIRKQLRQLIGEKGIASFLRRVKELQGTPVFQDIFGTAARKALYDLVDVLPSISKEMGKWGANADYVDKKMKGIVGTVEYQFNRAVATLESYFVELGHVLKGPMIDALQWINDKLQNAIDIWNSLTEEQIKNRLVWLKWTAVIGPAMLALGLLGTLVGSIVGLIGKLTTALKYIFTPWGLLIAAVATAVGWFIKSRIELKNQREQLKKTNRLVQEYGIMMDTAGYAGQEATRKLREQRVELSILRERLKDVSEEMQKVKSRIDGVKKSSVEYKTLSIKLRMLENQRKETIEDINTKFGTYLDNEIKAGMAYEEIAKQLDKVNERLRERIRIKATEAAKEEIMSRMVEVQRKIWKNEETIQKAQYGTARVAKLQYKTAKNTLSINKALMEGYLEEWQKLDKIFEKLVDNTNQTKDQNEEIKNQQEIWNDLMKTLSNVSSDQMNFAEKVMFAIKKLEVLGKSFDYTRYMVNLFGQQIDKAIKEEDIEKAKYLAKAYKIFAKEAEKSVPILKELQNQLDIISKKEWFLGKRYDENRQKLNAYQSAFNRLIERYVKLSEIEDPTKKQREALEKLREALGKTANKINKLKEEIRDTKKDVTEDAEIIANVIEGAFRRVQYAITDALRSIGEEGKNFGQIMGDMLKNLMYRLAAAAMAALVFTIIISAILPGVGPAGLSIMGKTFTKGADFGKIFGTLFSGSFGRFQEGGVVPSGYPNDSYPAMLTSGETVIPPEDLDEDKLEGEITINVQGVAKGEEIHWVLSEYLRKKGNTL